MKIVTFNINNINKRLENLLAWLRTAKPDVVCLQELKATDREFPETALAKAGYRAAWRGQKSWNGVAILARGGEPIVTRRELPGEADDDQARYIEAAVNGVLITSLYAPNGNPQPGPKFTYKLAWMERLIAHAADLFAADVPVVLAGDFNVVPTDRDIYPTKSYDKDALLQPESRVRYARLLRQGWQDAVRTLHPDEPMYSYWSYLRSRWPRDAGLRIDHLLLSKQAAKRLIAAGVDRDVRGEDNASDHAPVWIELADAVRTSPRKRGPSLVHQQTAKTITYIVQRALVAALSALAFFRNCPAFAASSGGGHERRRRRFFKIGPFRPVAEAWFGRRTRPADFKKWPNGPTGHYSERLRDWRRRPVYHRLCCGGSSSRSWRTMR